MYSFSLHIDSSSLTAPEIQAASAKYGCNMRTLFDVLVTKEEPKVLKKLRGKVKALSLSDIRKMLLVESEVSDQTSHSLLKTECPGQPKPGDATYGRSDVTIASISSQIVWNILFERHGRWLYTEITLMDDLFQTVPEMSSAGGWMWEGYCHTRIFNGSDHTLWRMTTNGVHLVPRKTNPEELHIDSLTPKAVDFNVSTVSTRNPDEYYIPEAKNNAPFDSLFLLDSTQIVLQIPSSTSHSLNSTGLLTLKKQLPAGFQQYFVFVVPKGWRENFKCEKPGAAGEKFRFFLLELDQEYCKNSTISVDMRKLNSLSRKPLSRESK